MASRAGAGTVLSSQGSGFPHMTPSWGRGDQALPGSWLSHSRVRPVCGWPTCYVQICVCIPLLRSPARPCHEMPLGLAFYMPCPHPLFGHPPYIYLKLVIYFQLKSVNVLIMSSLFPSSSILVFLCILEFRASLFGEERVAVLAFPALQPLPAPRHTPTANPTPDLMLLMVQKARCLGTCETAERAPGQRGLAVPLTQATLSCSRAGSGRPLTHTPRGAARRWN